MYHNQRLACITNIDYDATQITEMSNITEVSEDVTRVQVRVPDLLWRKAKAEAALAGVTAEQWVLSLIEREIEPPPAKRKQEQRNA